MAIEIIKTHSVSPIPTIMPTPTEYQVAGETGSRALWVVFILMLLASATLASLACGVPVSRRAYHVLMTVAAVAGALSYFAMASGQGAALRCERVVDSHKHVPAVHRDLCRQVHWVRFVDGAISAPLLLLGLGLAAGLDGAHTLVAMLAGLVMNLAGLFSALARDRTAEPWGWYAIAWVAFLVAIWHIAPYGWRSARERGGRVSRAWGSLALFALALWTIFPIIWGVGGGVRRISVDADIVIYAVLDVLAKAGFGLWLLLTVRRIPEMNVDLDGYWSRGANPQGTIRVGDNGGDT